MGGSVESGEARAAGRPFAFRAFIREATRTFRAGGFRGLLRVYGWKLLVAFTLFYLVRDVTLYILLPYLAARGLLSIWP
jgi:hypothetical protein